jgi:hypothetical protein
MAEEIEQKVVSSKSTTDWIKLNLLKVNMNRKHDVILTQESENVVNTGSTSRRVTRLKINTENVNPWEVFDNGFVYLKE